MITKKKAMSYVVKVVVFTIILGILAAILVITVGRDQINKTDSFFGDRFMDYITHNTYYKEIDINNPNPIEGVIKIGT